MSVKATNWAWEADLSPSQKLVLLALAHCHNGRTGQCNPRVSTIVDKTGLGERRVKGILKELREAGYIRPDRRRKGRRQASNQYGLALQGVVFSG